VKTCKYDPETFLYGMVTGLWQGLESSDDSAVFLLLKRLTRRKGPAEP
jgi:hypothetical protein